MLLSVKPKPALAYPVPHGGEPEAVSLRDVVDFLRRNLLIVAACVLALTALGGAYAFTTPPTYTAEARLIIDTSQSRIVLGEPDPYSLAMESARVDSEVELVKSRSIALAVIERLQLVDEKEYNAEPGLVQKLRRWIKATLGGETPIEAAEPDAQLRRAMGAYATRLGVRRLGQSYVIEISYSSGSAARAAEITNAIADAYIAAKVDSKAEAARRGAEWLQERLEELARQSNLASAAVEQFKAAQRIVKPDAGGSLAERQLMDTSVQLLQARGETSRLQARLDAVGRMLASGELTDVVAADAGENPILTVLRQRMIDARTRQSDILSRYGPQGSAATAAAAEIDQIRSEIRAELSRIRNVYRTDLEAAELNQTNTDGSLETMLDSAAELSGQYVQLAELESRASTFRRMYETMLQQFTQTVQRQSFPVSDARLVAPAVAPFVPSEPKTTLILALSGVLGMVLGLGLALGRTALETRVATGRQIETRTGVPCLAVLPRLSRRTRLRARLRGKPRLGPQDLAAVVKAPYSELARVLTSVKVSLDIASHQQRSLLVGVTSVGRDPKRSRLAGNLALLYAAEGRSTLLVDADHRWLTLTRSCAAPANRPKKAPADAGAVTLLGAEAEAGARIGAGAGTGAGSGTRAGAAEDGRAAGPAETVEAGPLVPVDEPGWSVVELDQGLHLASVATLGDASPHRTLATLRHRLEQVRWRYDVVVVDLPSMQESSHARALSPSLDVVLLSCEHRKTPIDEVGEAVASFGAGADRLLGIVIDGAPKARTHA